MVDTGPMWIGQLAELAGTTTRTVRHYHRSGLLDEPPRRPNGYREYTMADAIRLMRIRWLADSGVPLAAIPGMLDCAAPTAAAATPPRPIEADLEALIAGIDAQRAVLARRRERLITMLDDARRGRPLSPLPARLADLFRAVVDAESTPPATAAAVRRERDMVEALALSGTAPDGILEGFTALLADPQRRERYLHLLGRWAALERRDPASVRDETAAIADALAGLMAGWYDDAADAADGPGGDAPAPLLGEVVADPAQREVVRLLHARVRADDRGAP